MRTTFEFGDNPLVDAQPFRIAVAAPATCVRSRARPAAVDKDSFADVLATHAEDLLFEARNHLAVNADPLRIRLRITALENYSPAGLAAQIPELGNAVAFRDRLAALDSGKMEPAQFEAGLDAFRGMDAFAESLRLYRQAGTEETAGTPPPPPAAVASDDSAPDTVDRILDMVGTDVAPETAPELEGLNHLVSRIGTARARTAARGRYAAALTAADAVLSRQLAAILHHPALQAHEAFWRGLRFLVDHCDFRRAICVDLFATDRDRFGESIAERVFDDTDAAIGLLVAPIEIDNHPSDLEQLRILGDTAAQWQAPVLLSAGPALLQLDTGADAGRLPYPGGLFSRPEYDQWNALRDKDAARWLAVVFNRFLLRMPYGAQARGAIGIGEDVDTPERHLWGNAAWIPASLIAGSFARCGWPTEFTGADGGCLDGLALHGVDTGGGQVVQIPLEARLSEELAVDLAQFGITPVLCRANRDSACVLRAPLLHRPARYGDEAATAGSRAMATLPYALLAGRLAQAVADRLPRLRSAHDTAQDIGSALGEYLGGLLRGTGSGASVEIQVVADESAPQRERLDLVIRMGKQVLNGAAVPLSIAI
jgi:type VI secretion system protein ImpC